MKKEKSKKISSKKLKKHLSNYLVTFVTIFTALVVSYVTVSLFVFEQSNIHYYYLILITLIAAIESLLIELFVRINKISLTIQLMVVYLIICLTCLVFVVLIDKDLLNNLLFYVVAIPGSLIGLGALLLISYLLNRKEENALNAELLRFKGGKNNEK